MGNIIENLYMSFSEEELLTIVRSVAGNEKIPDSTLKMCMAALTLAWIPFDDLRQIMTEIENDIGE